MTFVVGITGGIGSGKTKVSGRFTCLGVTIADADIAAREVVLPGTEAWKKITHHFSPGILLKDDSLDRAKLREIVFADREARKWLESVTHPAIIGRCLEIIRTATSPYAMLVLSAGTGRSPLMNRLLVVDVPEELQIQRVMKRDNNSLEQVKSILAAQIPREQRLALADDIIDNRGSLDSLYKDVSRLHESYLQMAQSANQTDSNK
ncbi:MAG: dephospho-CoA kinase [Gammaproteobacteria bacterium]|nr:dephospho-CoA kinase [Gammaproteobacteria bacterium]